MAGLGHKPFQLRSQARRRMQAAVPPRLLGQAQDQRPRRLPNRIPAHFGYCQERLWYCSGRASRGTIVPLPVRVKSYCG